jgi:hypothetical protein
VSLFILKLKTRIDYFSDSFISFVQLGPLTF